VAATVPAPAAPEAAPPAEAPLAAAEPAQEPAVAGPARLAVGTAVEAMLRRGQAIRYPLTLGKGRYLIELFARAPSDTKGCTGVPQLGLTFVDRDGAITGETFGEGTWDKLNWKKGQRSYKVDGGAYAIALLAADWCNVVYRLRISAE
jgi:hypothetical protein